LSKDAVIKVLRETHIDQALRKIAAIILSVNNKTRRLRIMPTFVFFHRDRLG
jgi:hypothetical protein